MYSKGSPMWVPAADILLFLSCSEDGKRCGPRIIVQGFVSQAACADAAKSLTTRLRLYPRSSGRRERRTLVARRNAMPEDTRKVIEEIKATAAAERTGYSGAVGIACIYKRAEDVRQVFGAGLTWEVHGVSFRAPGSSALPTRGAASTLLEAKQTADVVWREWVLAAALHGESAMTVGEVIERAA